MLAIILTIIALLTAARNNSSEVFPNHCRKFFSQDILLLPGPRWPAIFLWMTSWRNWYLGLRMICIFSHDDFPGDILVHWFPLAPQSLTGSVDATPPRGIRWWAIPKSIFYCLTPVDAAAAHHLHTRRKFIHSKRSYTRFLFLHFSLNGVQFDTLRH